MTWNLAEAKNKLSEVVNLALTEGPQTITRGRRAARLGRDHPDPRLTRAGGVTEDGGRR